jgi:hypothetical protein
VRESDGEGGRELCKRKTERSQEREREREKEREKEEEREREKEEERERERGGEPPRDVIAPHCRRRAVCPS